MRTFTLQYMYFGCFARSFCKRRQLFDIGLQLHTDCSACLPNMKVSETNDGYIVMLRARMFRFLIPVLMIKEWNIRVRNITI